jgi:DNA-3-methyladenine glycosylase
MNNKVSSSYYNNPDVVGIARDLLGKQLWSNIDNEPTSGIIVETEAYCGATDQACHAFPNKRTNRTAVMYETGGLAYVYLVYGMSHLFNIVTNAEGKADAVLIRAIEPIEGHDIMKVRLWIEYNNRLLTCGPARLTQALGITIVNNKTNLQGDKIWLSEGNSISNEKVVATTRIGVDYAGEDAQLPWRFYIKGNKFVSK